MLWSRSAHWLPLAYHFYLHTIQTIMEYLFKVLDEINSGTYLLASDTFDQRKKKAFGCS